MTAAPDPGSDPPASFRPSPRRYHWHRPRPRRGADGFEDLGEDQVLTPIEAVGLDQSLGVVLAVEHCGEGLRQVAPVACRLYRGSPR